MTKIKYDKKDKRLYRKTAVIFSILAVADWCLLLNGEDILWHFPIEAEVVFLCAIGPLCILVVGLWVGYLDAVFYLKRLWKFGYEIPEDKRNYNKDLEKLPQRENTVGNLSYKNYDSMVLSILTGFIVIALFLYDIQFLYRYSSFGKDIWFFEGLLILGTFVWLFMGIFYVRQISNQKYKYDVEIDSSRKNRKNLIDGIVEIMVLLLLTFPFIEMINNAVQYMMRAREGR